MQIIKGCLGLPSIFRHRSFITCGIAILDTSLPGAGDSVQRDAVIRHWVCSAWCCWCILVDFCDSQRCAAGAGLQTVSGITRHTTEIGSDSICPWFPLLTCQCYFLRGSVGVADVCDLNSFQQSSGSISQIEINLAQRNLRIDAFRLCFLHRCCDGDGGTIRCAITNHASIAECHVHCARKAHITANFAVAANVTIAADVAIIGV